MSNRVARSLVFFSSASVLVIEVLAVRILAPYVGVSLEVFTAIIGVILAGISVGAWLGGRAADRANPRRLLGPLLIAGGLAAIASPLIVDFIGPALSSDPVSIVVASTLGFFLPAALLSAVSPIVVKIRLASLDQTGAVVGSFSAVGTAGAIFGTFLTGFFLIAAFPTRPIVIALGVVLTVAGLALAVLGRIVVISVVVGLIGLGGLLVLFDGPCDYETTYHCAIVEVDEDRPDGRVLVLDRSRNSYVDLTDPTYLDFRYIRLIVDVINTEAPEGPLNVVSVGGGGFTVPGYLNATRPGTTNVVLEIDRLLVDISYERLALSDDIEVIVDDARTSLLRLPDHEADVIVGDAYSGASVPWHLTTEEYLQDIDRVLAPDGVYVMNVIDYGSRRFARSAVATIEAVFEHVAMFAPPDYIDGTGGGNYILVAAHVPIDVTAIEAAIASRDGTEIGLSGDALARFVDGAQILTDDFAPVDQIVGSPSS